MTANDYQIGGVHYKSEYGHWDWVIRTNMHYLPANATKYAIRWRKKNGLQDLRKAEHYIIKLIESAPIIVPTRSFLPMHWVAEETVRFVRCNDLPPLEAGICTDLACWTTIDVIQSARNKLSRLIEAAEDAETRTFINRPQHDDESIHAKQSAGE